MMRRIRDPIVECVLTCDGPDNWYGAFLQRGPRPIADHQRGKQIVEREVCKNIGEPGATPPTWAPLFASGVSPSLLNVARGAGWCRISATEEAPMEPAGPRRVERRLAAISRRFAAYSRLIEA